MKYIMNQIRQKNPLVICLTNDVVKTYTANGLLAIGASPVMSGCIEDFTQLVEHADAVLLNIGTVTPALAEFYIAAARLAKSCSIPVILDPVGCHAGAFRLDVAKSIIGTGAVTVLRGNHSEMKALYRALAHDNNVNGALAADTCNDIAILSANDSISKDEYMSSTGKGVDGGAVSNPETVSYRLARLLGVHVVSTGAIDYISNGTRIIGVHSGDEMMSLVTGTGCLQGAVIAAAIGTAMGLQCADRHISVMDALVESVSMYGLAGERAIAVVGNNPGSFSVSFIDSLYNLEPHNEMPTGPMPKLAYEIDCTSTDRTKGDIEINHCYKTRAVLPKESLRVYFVCGTQDVDCDATRFISVVEQALEAGVTCFQYREKGPGALTGQEKYSMAKRLQSLCQTYGVLYIINDDVELAKAIRADGVHVGQGDMTVAKVRRMVGPNMIIGVSIHDEVELAHTALDYVDYVGVGPIFVTGSKSDAKEPCGPDRIRELRSAGLVLPIVGIGGITVDNAKAVMDAGADGVAVISAITRADDIDKAVKQLQVRGL